MSDILVANNVYQGTSITTNTFYSTSGAFAIDQSNEFQGTLWALKNNVIANGYNSVLGTAAYQVFDKDGSAIVGMSESGIAADPNGQFVITPVASLLNKSLDHYLVKVSITVDGNLQENYVGLIQPIPDYEVGGAFSLNTSNELTANFWVSADEQVVTNPARLGTAAYVIYDKTGTLVPGMSESGISADSNGLYEITPVASVLGGDLTFYTVKVTITVDNVARSEFLPILGKIPSYAAHAQFSINALNQMQATLWATTDGVVKSGAGLGVANYTVYDSTGTAVVGLTQSGITADSNGRFIITPVSATLLTDLTHYSVKVGIVVDGVERISYRGFTLLGT